MGPLVGEIVVFAKDSEIGLVGDIGGTNARFALAGLNGAGAVVTAFRQDLRNDDFSGLEACVSAYLSARKDAPSPTMGAFGVASPITGDQVRLTNRDWTFSIAGLKRAFGWRRFEVVNDFVALGHALAGLRASDWRALAGPPWPRVLPRVVSLVGPGTGFGVGTVLLNPGTPMVVASEGGHASLAAVDEVELEILRAMLARFPRVSNERILSGPGLENLYVALADIRGSVVPPLPAPEILDAVDRDPLATETIDRFCLMLAGVMGDVALIHGAGAVAVGGGIAGRMIKHLDTAQMRARFEAKGRAQPLMATIPIALITHPDPGLLGAARMLFEERVSNPAPGPPQSRSGAPRGNRGR
jgi:glucokinase